MLRGPQSIRRLEAKEPYKVCLVECVSADGVLGPMRVHVTAEKGRNDFLYLSV